EPSQDVLTIEQAQTLKVNRAALEANKVKAIILMTRHMDDSLQYECMNEENPKRLWVSLEERFGKVRDSLLPDLEV
ncbi:hypothetical protein NF717_12445, partial [Lactococcus formosensis]|nr:hypothetical protein [Lactococcus formosensis]